MNKIKICFCICFVFIIMIISTTINNFGVTIYSVYPNMTSTVVNEIIPYTTTYIYDENKPSDSTPEIVTKGINGLSYTYDGVDYTILTNMTPQVEKKGTGKSGAYVGHLTGYGPDCPGCSKVGNVSCKTREGSKHSLIYDGITYIDSIYGEVRILAAETKVFPCGTIIKVDNGVMDEFYGVVLDTGYTMRKAWSEGVVWIDLAYSSQSEKEIKKATSSNTKFNVQRWGW